MSTLLELVKMLALATVAGLLAARFASPLTAATVGAGWLYLLLVIATPDEAAALRKAARRRARDDRALAGRYNELVDAELGRDAKAPPAGEPPGDAGAR